MARFPPPPNTSNLTDQVWRDWFYKLSVAMNRVWEVSNSPGVLSALSGTFPMSGMWGELVDGEIEEPIFGPMSSGSGSTGPAGPAGPTGPTGPMGPLVWGLDGEDGETGMPIPGSPGASAAGTNLSYTASTRILASDTGTDVTLPVVTSTDAGLAPATGGGTANFLRADATWAAPPVQTGTTNLAYTASTRLLTSDTGTDVTLPLVTSTEAGLAPLSGGGTTNFLRADGTWAAPASGSGLAQYQVRQLTRR